MLEAGQIGAAFDNTGKVFALGLPTGHIKLYDSRNYSVGPFASSAFALPGGVASILFSPCGNYILLAGYGKSTVILNSRTYEEVSRLTGVKNDTAHKQLGVTFSPDSQYVASASEDGSIHVWETRTGKPITRWVGHACNVSALKWHPTSVYHYFLLF